MDLRYPIGHFEVQKTVDEQQLSVWIDEIESLPRRLNQLVKELTEQQLATAYRPNGWTVRQVVHHLADSHLNSYTRMKLAATEQTPVVKTYDEQLWAQQADYEMPVDVSLNLIAALHLRWVYFLRHLSAEQVLRDFQYPDGKVISLEEAIGLYAWHGNHHLAHIEQALDQKKA